MAKRGRGRLSTIDLLPEEAEPFVSEALADLRKRAKPQTQILQVLNLKLAGIGAPPISKSAFNRKALWWAGYGAQIEHAREIAAVVGTKLDEAPDGDVGRLLSETIKTLIFDVLSEASLSQKSPSIVMLGVASEALRNLEKAREINVGTSLKVEQEVKKRAAKAVDAVAKVKGISAATVKDIKAQILGVRTAPEKAATPAA